MTRSMIIRIPRTLLSRLLAVVLLCLITPVAGAQNLAQMVNGATLNIAACNGTVNGIVDDGGSTGTYSNSFNGSVVLTWDAGVTLTLQGTYNTESYYDYLILDDGSGSTRLEGLGTCFYTSSSGMLTITFHSDGSVTYDGFVLTWTVGGASGCSNSVSNLTVSNIGTTSATLAWDATDPTGPFNIICNSDTVTATSTTYTLTGLNSSTQHTVTVHAVGETSICCRAVATFRTTCDTVHMPWTESFEGMPLDTVPLCWTMLTNFDNVDVQPRVTNTYASHGDQSLMISCGDNSTGGHFGMVFGPRLDLGDAGYIHFDVRASHYGTYLVLGTCNYDSSYTTLYDFTPFDTIYVSSLWSTVSLPSRTIATGRSLAFYMLQSMQSGVNRRVYIDAIGIDACGIQSASISHVESDRLTLSWTTYGTTTVDVHVRRSSATTDEQVIAAATSPLLITGLEASTAYDIILATQCGTSATVYTTTADSANALTRWCLGPGSLQSDVDEMTKYNSTANVNSAYVTLSRINSGIPSHILSPEFNNLAGKQIAVTLDGYYANVSIGLMRDRYDTTTFTPLDTCYTGYFRSKFLFAEIPDTNTATFVALRYQGSYIYVRRMEIGSCLIDSLRVVHERGSSIVFALASTGADDTIQVEYGYSGFTPGSGTTRTYVGRRRITIDSLPYYNYNYDFIFSRPCGGDACYATRLRAATACRDYYLPYCEDFSNYLWSNSGYGYPIQRNTYDNTPAIVEHPYYPYAGMSLKMSSYGLGDSYYTSVVLPDVTIDTGCYLSFYATNMAPDGQLMIGNFPLVIAYGDNYNNNGIRWFDTVTLAGYNVRQHFVVPLPADDTLFDRRLIIRYGHQNPYQNFSVYIDEMHITHGTYSEATVVGADSSSAHVTVVPYTAYDTIFEVSLRNEADVLISVDTVTASDTAHFGGLTRCTRYKLYVRPLTPGDTLSCPSYSQTFSTQCNNFQSTRHCFGFDSELSYELPYGWTATDDASHSVDTSHLHLYGPDARLCTPYYGDIEGQTVSLAGRGHGTLVVGYADTAFSRFYPFDTLTFTSVDTLRYYTHRLPGMASDTLRIGLRVSGATDTLLIDHLGISLCRHIDIAAEDNTAVATTDDDDPLYYLYVSDSIGNERMFLVNTPTFTVNDLTPGWKYEFSWQCAYDDETCRPHVTLRIDNHIKAPYCIDFQNGTAHSAADAWDLVSPSPSAYRYDDGSSVSYYTYYTPSYLLLPPLDSSTTVATLDAYIYRSDYYDSSYHFDIGVLTDGSDTSSFVSLWSAPTYSGSAYIYPMVDISGYAGKRIAIRYNGYYITAYRLFIHPYTPMTVRQVESNKFELINSHGDYYVRIKNYTGTVDSILHIDSTYHLLDLTHYNINDYYYRFYLQQVDDSLGNVCRENMTQYYFRSPVSVPWCWSSGLDILYFKYYSIYSNSTYFKNKSCAMLYGERTTRHNQIIVMPEFDVDSVRNLNIKFSFASEESDTQMVEIGVMTDALDTTTFVPVDTIYYQAGDSSWADYQVTLDAYAAGGRWVAFRYNPEVSSGYRYSYLGDFCIDVCPATTATAKLERWNSVRIDNLSGEGGFYVAYRPSYSYSYTILRIDTVPTTLTLDANRMYYFRFRCDSSSDYTCRGDQTVTTLGTPMDVPSCLDFESVAPNSLPDSWRRYNYAIGVTTDQAHSGSRSLAMPVTGQSYVVTGDIDTDTLGNIAMSFWLYTATTVDLVEVGAMSNPLDLTTFQPIQTVSNRLSGVWERHVVILDGAPHDAHYLALRAGSTISAGSSRSIYVDDFHLSTCATNDMHLAAIESDTLTIEWNQTGNPDITVTVVENGTVVQTLHPTSSPLSITGLSQQNTYAVHFDADCGETDTNCTTNYADSLTIVAPGEGAGGCINPTDIYSTQATFFSGTYSNPYATSGAIDFGSLDINSRHTVCTDTAYRDPRTGGLLRSIPEGYTSSLRLGNWGTNSYAPEAEGVIYSLLVDTADFELILLHYAAVLQDPLHAAEDQPRFRIEVLDSAFVPIDPSCTSADFIANASLGWNVAEGSVLWKDWTTVGIDLSSFGGQQVYIRLTTYDCNEGSHYGYAYFTLECMRKRMATTACGDIDSNTYTAPAGFNYRWYSSASAATISTAQSITMATANVTYYCDLSKIDNANCMFTISAYGGTRYPMASADTTMTISGCQFHVSFTNTSTVSSDGVTPMPGEECESAWWDFGNGQTATTYHASTVYSTPGTYTVMLVSGIAGDACKDTMLWSLNIDFPTNPVITGPTDLCYGDIDTLRLHYVDPQAAGDWVSEEWHDTNSVDNVWMLPLSPSNYSIGSNLYTLATTDVYGCTPTASHTVAVHPILHQMDTLRICTPMLPYSYTDTVFQEGTESAEYHLLLQNVFGCDSSYHLWLTVSDTGYGTALDTVSVSICDNQSYTFFDSAYTVAGVHNSVHLDSVGFCDSLHTLLLDVRPTSHTDTLADVCDQYTWYGIASTADTAITRLLQNSVLCDSTVTLGLTVRHSTDTSIHHYIVENQVPYVWNGLTFYTDTTNCIIHTTNAVGCDSTITFALTVYLNRDTVVDSTVCEGMLPLVWNGVTFNTDDAASNSTLTMQATLTGSFGVDSAVTMRLHLLLNTVGTDSDTIVQNQLPWTWNGLTLTAEQQQPITAGLRGLDTVTTIVNTVGCDSTIDYTLLVYWNRQTLLDSTVCDDVLPLTWEGLTFTQAATQTSVISTVAGADSTLVLTLNVNPTYDVNDTLIFCSSQNYIYEGIDYGGPVSFDAPHLSALGCDSLVHVSLVPRDTTFRTTPLYSLDSAEWLPLDTLVLGCAPDTLMLRDTTRGATAWLWTVNSDGATLTSTDSIFSVVFDSPITDSTSSVTLTVTTVLDGVTCNDTVQQPIYIFRTPQADFDWSPLVPAIDNPEMQFHNLSSPADALTYLWYIPKQSGSSDCDTSSETDPFYHWSQSGVGMEGDYDVRLVAYWTQTALYDTAIHHVCTDTATRTVTITNDYLQFPNLVTPNGDGKNDTWRIINLVEYGNFPQNELWIFNQWGAEVYHVRDIRDENVFWDPNATNSPDGTYYYRFSAHGPYGVVKRNGIIEVLR